MRNRVLLFLALLLIPAMAFAGGRQEEGSDQAQQTDAEMETQTAEPSSEGASEGASDTDSEPGTRIDTTDSGEAVASVNGVAILREDYETAVEQTRLRFAQQGRNISDTEMESFRTEILDQLIAEELLYQEALRQGLEPEEQAVESQLQQMRSQFETDEQWQQALASNNTTEEDLRIQIERNSVIQQVVTDAVGDSTQVSQQEIQEFYENNPEVFEQGEQIAARHILISTEELEGDAAIEEARQRAQNVRQELLGGADFAALAQERSEGPSASRGGELGTFGRGQMVPAFEETAFALEEGEISQVVETRFGFHVIQVTEKIEGGTAPVEQVSANIEQYLGQQKRADVLAAYVEQLREDAEVDINS